MPTFRAGYTVVASTPPLLIEPPLYAPNDLLFCLVNTLEDVAVTPPEGFVLVPGCEVSGPNRTSLWMKVAADEPDAYVVNWASGMGTVVICAVQPTSLAYAAVDQVAIASLESSSATKVWPSVTNGATATLLMCFGGFGGNASTTPAAGMTERFDTHSNRVYLMTQAVGVAGPTGTRTGAGSSVTRQRLFTLSVAETDTYPIDYPAELRASAVGTLVETQSAGVEATELAAWAEMRGLGIYLSGVQVLVEFEYVEPTIVPTYFPDSAGTRRMHRMLPEEVSGYAFDPEYAWWSSVLPEASTNLIINPSFERLVPLNQAEEYEGVGLDLYQMVSFPAVGATQGRNCALLAVAAGDSGWLEYAAGLAVTPGPYTFSCDIYVASPPYRLHLLVMSEDGSQTLARRVLTVRQSGWHRYALTYVEASSGSRVVRLALPSANDHDSAVYTDAWQFEAKKYATTYLDGDMMGWNDTAPYQSYYWHGAPHRSISARRARTGSGGRVVNWAEEAHFKTTSIVGLGMTTVEQKTQTLGDGRELHLSTFGRARDFTITGRIFGINHRDLLNRRNDLIRLLKPNNTPGGDQMILRFQEVDDNEQRVGAPLDLVCVYREGMQGNLTSLYQENLPLQFRAVQPFPQDVIESSAQVRRAAQLPHNGLVYRDEQGEYRNAGMGTTTGGVANRVGFLRDGRMVAMGNFNTIAGSVAQYAAAWDGEAWVQLGESPPDGTTEIEDGYRSGYPLTVSDVDGKVYEYDDVSDSWSALGSGFIGPIHALQRDRNGDVWVGGDFEFASDGVSVFNNVARWNYMMGEWQPLGFGLQDNEELNETLQVNTVLVTDDGNVYFGGSFQEGWSNPGTTLANRAIRWDTTTNQFDAMGTGLDAAPNHFLLGQDGYIYATGPFEKNGTQTFDLHGFARYNGYEWEKLFSLRRVDGTYGADGMIQDEEGIIWFYAYDTDSGDHFDIEGLGVVRHFGWRNGIFYPPFMYPTAMAHMAIGPGNRALFVTRTEGSFTHVPALNRIHYAGSADAPLVLHLDGPFTLGHIANLSAEGGIYGRADAPVTAYEQMVVRSDGQRALIYSNQRASLHSLLAVGASNFKTLRLRPGENRLSVFAYDGTTVAGWATWKNRFWGLEDVRE